MKNATIKKPKGSAVIFLLTALSNFSTVALELLCTTFLNQAPKLTTSNIIIYVIWGISHLFIARILFTKRYDNLLIIALSTQLIPCIIGLFTGSLSSYICEVIFYMMLIAFTYIMVKMPETPLREKVSKVRFIIPLSQIALIIFSTMHLIQGLFEKLASTSAAPLSNNMNAAIVAIPSIVSAFSGVLPVLCYVWLANWLAYPYEKK